MSAHLYQPALDDFLALAGRHTVVPVWREVLADLETPVGVYRRLRRSGGTTFLLESVEGGERWGRYSFIGLRPLLSLRAAGGEVRVDATAPGLRVEPGEDDPLAAIERLLEALRAPQLPGLPPLFAGLVGYLGYDIARFIERLPDTTVDDLGMDDARLDLPGQLVAFDHLRQRLLVVTNVLVGDDPARQYEEAMAASEVLVRELAAGPGGPPVAPPHASTVRDAKTNIARDDFLAAVERAKDHIRAGDVFQVVPSQRYALSTRVDALAVYRVLRLLNPSPYMYLFDYGDAQVVGSSPEALVTVRAGTASIWPIAGSRPRGTSVEEDEAFERALRADEKERAEHVMLVDLARNDLGRVCELGSVSVDVFMDVVRYSHVMHLVSTVTGRLRPGTSSVDVLRAAFPAGTLTGAPKVRAMQIIDDLEPTRRGLYGGGIGYLDLAGNIDLCIAIRTLVLADGHAYVQAGAGVVADSVPERELEETQNKAMALLAAVRAAEQLEDGPEPG